MSKPPAVRPGDTVAVVAPASPAPLENLKAGLDLLEGRGYRLRLGRCCSPPNERRAWSDEERAKELTDAWFDPEINAVICSRGGYGCARILGALDLDAMAAEPKLFVGFSDITTLHLALNRRGLATLYAPMPLSFAKERKPWVIEGWFAAMEGAGPFHLPPEAPRAETLTPGTAEGDVVGGCLCLLCDSLATPEALNAEGRILLIEDANEPPHRVDAMLTHLLNAGVAQSAAGIVVGEMTGTDERREEGASGPPWKEIVAERLGGLGVPTVVNFPFGHHTEMSSLPLGVRARLDADAGILTYLELGVTTE
ncbi:MAG: LD-carboxypeptidase [Armatimonadetes bacterium]|nr:LD-carboxypeptidase [Armatimonadota bacterium]